MQTPPPTRGTSQRKRALHSRSVSTHTPTNLAPAMLSTPISSQSVRTIDFATRPSPAQSVSVDFAADIASFPLSAPLPSDMYQAQGSFWDGGSGYHSNDMAMATGPGDSLFQDGIAMDNSYLNHMPLHSAPLSQGVHYKDASGQLHMNNIQPAYWSQYNLGHGPEFGAQVGLSASPTSGVDPSLLFAPSTTANSSFSANRTALSGAPNLVPQGRQPYQHQALESAREKELIRKARSKHSRTSTASSSSSASQSKSERPKVHRSSTDGILSTRHSSSTEVRAQISGDGRIGRRTSPTKRANHSFLGSITEDARSRPRKSIVLTVDEYGRAHAESRRSRRRVVPE
jgi:hypothetical protein